MTRQRQFNTNFGGNSLVGAIFLIFTIIGLFFIANFIFGLLYKYSWLLLIPILIVDYKVIPGFIKWIAGLFKINMGYGLGASFLSVVFYPVTILFLLGKAFFNKKVNEIKSEMELREKGEYAEFEEMPEEAEFLELPPIEPEKRTRGNDYDKMFD